jgi:hypothetical protein
MIQRIQTVFIFIAVLLLGLMYFFPFAEISVGENLYEFNIKGIFLGEKIIYPGMILLIFLILIILLHVFVMFRYKKRILQIRILIFVIILLLGFTGVLAYFAWSGFSGETVSFSFPVAMPIVAAILDYLAIRYIGKDEALIRSLNRIRP